MIGNSGRDFSKSLTLLGMLHHKDTGSCGGCYAFKAGIFIAGLESIKATLVCFNATPKASDPGKRVFKVQHSLWKNLLINLNLQVGVI